MNIKNFFNLICLLLIFNLVGCNGENATVSETTSETETSIVQENGWKTLQGEGISLSVPPTYEGGNPGKDIDILIEKLISVNPDYKKEMEAIKFYADSLLLLAFDLESAKTTENLTGINVTTKDVSEETSLESFLEQSSTQLSQEQKIEVLENEIVSHPEYKIGKLVAETSPSPDQPKAKSLIYAISAQDKFWIVTYNTAAEEFEQRLPNFEKSIQSFQILEEAS